MKKKRIIFKAHIFNLADRFMSTVNNKQNEEITSFSDNYPFLFST